MTKIDLIRAVAKTTGVTIDKADDAVEAVLGAVKKELKKGNEVIIRKFGKFHVRHKKERMARNPKTGEPAVVTARRVVMFKPASTWKEELSR